MHSISSHTEVKMSRNSLIEVFGTFNSYSWYEGGRCAAYQKARDALTKHFKFVAFHPGQLAASDATTTWQGCTGKDGYGSRKIQIPVMYLVPLAMRTSAAAVGVVISPLNGLMDQQVCVR